MTAGNFRGVQNIGHIKFYTTSTMTSDRMAIKMIRITVLIVNNRKDGIDMARVWKEGISPKYMHDNFGIYQGIWMPQMDRCWFSDDGYQVTSRILITDWGKIEHAAITRNHGKDGGPTCNGERDIPWAVKQEIKNEIFGEKRVAIEVFPAEANKIDVMDIYHLWVFPKNFVMPFGIHPKKDKMCKVVNRGYPKDPSQLVRNSADLVLGEDADES